MMIWRKRPLMATWFEVYLGGWNDRVAIADAALDEVARVERVLSRFDPAAELVRVNREAPTRPVRASPELRAVLRDCLRWWAVTEGYFDPCHASPAPFGEVIEIDDDAGTVRLRDRDARIDLGGFAKGYALDRALRVVEEFRVGSAFLHGGTSSAVARGVDPRGDAWDVKIRDPFAADPNASVGSASLHDQALSSSAIVAPGSTRTDLVDPTRRAPLEGQAGVSVFAASAAEAEVYSTALLAMGRAGMEHFLHRHRPPVRVCWVDRDGMHWFRPRPGGNP